jgi:hypothetical protein
MHGSTKKPPFVPDFGSGLPGRLDSGNGVSISQDNRMRRFWWAVCFLCGCGRTMKTSDTLLD